MTTTNTTATATGPGLLVETAEWLAAMAGGAVPTLAGLRAGFAEVVLAARPGVGEHLAAVLAEELVDTFTAFLSMRSIGSPTYFGPLLTETFLASARVTDVRNELVAAADWCQQQLTADELREVA